MARLQHVAVLVLAIVAGLGACTPHKDTMSKPVDQKSPLAGDAVAGITDEALRAVVADHWEFMMRWMPTWATTLGDHRYDDKLAPRDAASIDKMNAERDALLARMIALEPEKLGEVDRITYAELRARLEAEHGLAICKSHEWVIDSSGGSVVGGLRYSLESTTG